jgi:hypothetical protein
MFKAMKVNGRVTENATIESAVSLIEAKTESLRKEKHASHALKQAKWI